MKKKRYRKIKKVPANVRFDIPGRNQGQIIEVAYGGVWASEHDEDDPYMRVTDYSLGRENPDRVTYYKLIGYKD